MSAPKDPEKYEAWRKKLRDARKKNLYRTLPLKVYLRPFIRQTLEEKMPVKEGLAFLDKKTLEYKKMYGK
jgi:hypothetical protein